MFNKLPNIENLYPIHKDINDSNEVYIFNEYNNIDYIITTYKLISEVVNNKPKFTALKIYEDGSYESKTIVKKTFNKFKDYYDLFLQFNVELSKIETKAVERENEGTNQV
jgi:hypothetical protein